MSHSSSIPTSDFRLPNSQTSELRLPKSPAPSRRELLTWLGAGLGGAALIELLAKDGLLQASPVPGEAADLPPHHTPKAKRAIHIYCCGGVSQVDSFDYKPD